MAENARLENAPQILDRPPGGTLLISTASATLKEERRQIGNLNARGAMAMNNAGSLNEPWIRASSELLPMMGMDSPDQGRVHAASLVEDQQAPIAKPLALALQARQEQLNSPQTSNAQIASGLADPLCRHKRNPSSAGLNHFQTQPISMHPQRRLIAKNPPPTTRVEEV
ncbi:MAG TPA: hypothetical protein VIS95_09710 [Solirubrobacterales bacterium]